MSVSIGSVAEFRNVHIDARIKKIFEIWNRLRSHSADGARSWEFVSDWSRTETGEKIRLRIQLKPDGHEALDVPLSLLSIEDGLINTAVNLAFACKQAQSHRFQMSSDMAT